MTIEEALAVVEQILERGRLNKVEELVLRQSWEGLSYGEIARLSGYEAGYIKDTGYKLWNVLSKAYGVKVSKHNLQGVLKRAVKDDLTAIQNSKPKTQNRTDWGDAIDVSIFYGRTQEITTLQHWILEDRCRLVTLLGMGGMGKTALSVKLAEQMQGEFDAVIWRSLRDTPAIADLLTTLIRFLSPHQDLSQEIGDKISQLVELLRRSRCLIILDNFDALLEGGKRAGAYRDGYQEYGELLKRVGEIAHQSCVVLTSREKPQEVSALEGEKLPIRTWSLAGVDAIAGHHILDAKGLTSSRVDTAKLIEHYRGNPLALKIAATSIQDLFSSDIGQFLEQGTVVFNGIGSLLTQQMARLSDLEAQVMDWLAINREAVLPSELRADIVPELSSSKLVEVLESLRWRSLIESSPIGFTLQPVVMEFVTERLIEQVSHEIITQSPQRFLSHALVKAQAKDYIRDTQIRVIVRPVVEQLLAVFRVPKAIEHHLTQLLVNLQESAESGYGGGNLLNLFRHLGTDLTGYDFSQLQIRQADLRDINLHHVNFAHAEFIDCSFAATFGGITSVAFSPDGQLLATSDTNGDTQLWNASQGQQLGVFKGHAGWVWRVIFSSDQQTLASCGQDHTIRLWNIHTGQLRSILHGHTSIVTDIAFSPDAQQLASSSEDQTIKLWDVETGQCLKTFYGHGACVWSVIFHPHDRTLISAGEDNAIKVWDIATENCLKTLIGHQQWVKTIVLSSDGQMLISGSFDSTIKLWDLHTERCLETLVGHQGVVFSVSLSPDGKILASGSYDQTVKLWSLQTGECVRTLQKHTNRVWSVGFHPQKDLLASGGDDHTARLWDIYTGQCTKTVQGHSNSIYTIALNPTNCLLASGHEDQTIRLWKGDFKSPTQPCTILRGHTNRVFSVAFSPDGSVLVSASLDRTLKLWNVHTGKCLNTLQGHTSWVWAIAFSPDGTLLASASYDQTVKLWDAHTGKCLRTLSGHTSSVLAIAFSPDGQWLASSGYEQIIKLWDVSTGECFQTLEAHTNRVWAVVFSPDAQRLATCGDDQTIKLWDIKTGDCLQTLHGHTSQVLSIIFDQKGNKLISSSADTTIRVWDVATGECLNLLQGHQNWVWSIVLTNDDRTLLSGSQDETIQSWDLTTGQHLQRLQAPRPYEKMNIKGAIGLTQAQKATVFSLGAIASEAENRTVI
ncbi:NACHT domain-containing protein [Phormidesmis priestleyi ULC007]|uniref:NACHT domain-containing protein n=1 Tax=Phormidesmis priestleyi ULC007 TaxID=1920490 RepID=A0A2T1DMA3_9CYAN|nr:NB-ARC domain-containing protein [Phormidesmis priestleyi]PSB21592.1 NACHT domain-containing protein [Phormidesmis priestleyi ULC007]PZO54633.1 MAG: NACHT domain-containing protein [Phormidesmis priestleyi]